MTATLAAGDRVVVEGQRRPRPEDERQLAELMLAAYEGTVDKEEETIEQAVDEIRKTFVGDYGPYLPDSSRVVDRDGRIVSATLVTAWQERPFVAFSMTAPAFKRQGIARASMVNTMQDVLASGEGLMSLVVTVENRPAFDLYRSLGFVGDQ